MSPARTVAYDAIGNLLDDWRISLRARGRSTATIADYLIVGQSFVSYLAATGMPISVTSIAREHVEQYLAGMLYLLARYLVYGLF